MTHVTFHRSRERQGIRGFTVEGHAGAAEAGEVDLVCCAVSVLTDTTANALTRVAGIEPVIGEGDGQLACFLPAGLDEAQWATAQIIFATMESGITDIASQYSSYIRLEQQ